jgi:hypothetical protein
MPILDIEIVGNASEVAAALPQAIADEAGRIFGAAPGTTWVRVRVLPLSGYAENEATLPAHPVFVTVTKRRLPGRAELEAEVSQLTQGIARLTQRAPENVHVTYEPAAAGRAAFGGVIVE